MRQSINLLWIIIIIIKFVNCNRHHICEKINSGNFDQINLKSCTFRGKDELNIFESSYRYQFVKLYPHTQIIEENINAIGTINNIVDNGIAFPSEFNEWNFDIQELTFQMIKPEKMRTISFLTGRGYYYVNIVYDTSNILWNFAKAKISWSKDWLYKQPFRIIAEKKGMETNGIVTTFDPSLNGFVFYKLIINPERDELNIPPNRDEVHIFTLERTGNVNKIQLRNIEQGSSTKDGQLFQQIPLGIVEGDHVILFDTKLHCVYIIYNLIHIFMEHGTIYQVKVTNITLERNNIPFEHFFHCLPKSETDTKHPLGIDRCSHEYTINNVDPIYGKHAGSGIRNFTGSLLFMENFLLNSIYLCCGIIIVIIIIIVLMASLCCKVNQRNESKCENASKKPFIKIITDKSKVTSNATKYLGNVDNSGSTKSISKTRTLKSINDGKIKDRFSSVPSSTSSSSSRMTPSTANKNRTATTQLNPTNYSVTSIQANQMERKQPTPENNRSKGIKPNGRSETKPDKMDKNVHTRQKVIVMEVCPDRHDAALTETLTNTETTENYLHFRDKNKRKTPTISEMFR